MLFQISLKITCAVRHYWCHWLVRKHFTDRYPLKFHEFQLNIFWRSQFASFCKLHYTPCRNIKRFWQMRQYQEILTLEMHCGQWENIFFKAFLLVQQRFLGNIYIEKYNKILTSELRWDIYGFNKDDPDIYGFLIIPYIPCQWHRNP